MGHSSARTHLVLAIAVTMSTAFGAAPVMAQSVPVASQPSAPVDIGFLSTMAIEPAGWTSAADVTLHLPAPPDGAPKIGISLDGWVTWVVADWAPTVPLSLIDPAAGGVDADGEKYVTVQYGNGLDWTYQSSGRIRLDRDTPSDDELAAIEMDTRLWQASFIGHDGEPLPDIAQTRYSIDGGAMWRPWTNGNKVNLWNDPAAVAWYEGDHAIDVQLRDFAGNESEPIHRTATVGSPDFPYRAAEWNLPGVRFETPHAPITGRPFTIRVKYPDGYVLPSNAWCRWRMTWGDDKSVLGTANPTWGELMIERAKGDHAACAEWTFTLPYRAARQFSWSLTLGTKSSHSTPMEFVTDIFSVGGYVFRALDGPHEPRFASSTIPFVYVLPEDTIVQVGDPITYRLHVVPTTTSLPSGHWWASPLACSINPSLSQNGGSTFTYRPSCDGPWVTGWIGTMGNGIMRSQYDPLADGRAPKVDSPRIALRSAAFGSTAPATVKWSGRDGGSGVYRYLLEVSRNGGSWQRLDLPSRLSTSFDKALGVSGTYRFRVRARDKVGNWSAWVYGPTVKAFTVQESSARTVWSPGWRSVAGSSFSGGKAKQTGTTNARGKISTTARSIAWVGRRGPGRGLAEVWVDGTLAATIDLGATTPGPRSVLYAKSWATAGTHTVLIKALGTAGRPLVEVDAFLVVK